MTMTIDNNQQRHHLGSMGFGHLPYSGPPHFSNPWAATTAASSSSPSYGSSLPYDGLPKSQSPKPSALSAISYSSMPATVAPSLPAATASYSSSPFSHAELLNPSPEVINATRSTYDSTYVTAPTSQTSTYAPTSSYVPPPLSSYGQSLAQQQQEQSTRRVSPTATSLPQVNTSFSEAHLDGARGMVAMAHNDITPRNIYGPRGDRGSTDSYGFPATHSSHSSISSASTYPSYFGAGSSVDGSVTDYSSASESVDGLNSRTLPRPNALMGASHPGLPPAPQSMMGSFNSKISSSTQKKHKCKVCDKRFTRPSSLQTHMYSHTGEKPFACEVPGCGRNFSVVSNLRRHRKVHKGDRGADEHDHGSPEGSWGSHE